LIEAAAAGFGDLGLVFLGATFSELSLAAGVLCGVEETRSSWRGGACPAGCFLGLSFAALTLSAACDGLFVLASEELTFLDRLLLERFFFTAGFVSTAESEVFDLSPLPDCGDDVCADTFLVSDGALFCTAGSLTTLPLFVVSEVAGFGLASESTFPFSAGAPATASRGLPPPVL